MFDTRARFFLLFLLLFSMLLAGRAAYIQVLGQSKWREQATRLMERPSYSETIRGRILDVTGKTLAEDQACVDACVDYRVITQEPNAQWVQNYARARLVTRLADGFTGAPLAQRKEMLAAEIKSVHADLQNLWPTLARIQMLPGDPESRYQRLLEEIQDIRQGIEFRVQMQQRWLWYKNFQKAAGKSASPMDSTSNWRKFLLGEETDQPKIDSFDVKVGEESEPHVVLRAISSPMEQYLAKNIDHLPGLVLRPGAHRVYPQKEVACHIIGNLSRAGKADLQDDIDAKRDELRSLRANDLVGRSGLEKFCELDLRGTRGKTIQGVQNQEIFNSPATTGADVVSTIDSELQRDVQKILQHAPMLGDHYEIARRIPAHGAAVVIDVASGEIRALASNPTFDLDSLSANFARLREDDMNNPTFNRATMAQLEPGSTVKPIVGLSAIAMNVLRPDETIECTGFLVLRGKKKPFGRCWVASKYLGQLGEAGVAHHQIPQDAKSPTGFLDYPEALERSCNVFFETLADRIGLQGMAYSFDRFGLGRETGIGIAESKGRLPTQATRDPEVSKWFSGIGQGDVAATPLQMANVAATIARNGVWLQPTLVRSPIQYVQKRVDLGFSKESLALCRQGMVRVVNSPAGSAYRTSLRRSDMIVAAKSGSAQASRYTIPRRDQFGNKLKDEKGKYIFDLVQPSTETEENPQAPWYIAHGKLAKEFTHSWMIGFAPADKPQVAFAVMIEYGGGGGTIAGPTAGEVLDACIEHGYLQVNK